jgi:hypothetical protein
MTNLTMERNLLYNIAGAEERLQYLQDMASSGRDSRSRRTIRLESSDP